MLMPGSGRPSKITPAILALAHELVDGGQPQFVDVTPVADADPNDCFPVVERYARQHGGSVSYGWQIWEWPGVMVEAEFHAVHRSPAGALRDLTPKLLPTPRILFLPDPTRRYEGTQVSNVRRPLTADPRIVEFIQVCNDEFQLMNRGSRALQHGDIELSGEEATELVRIQERKAALYAQLASRPPRPGRNDPCTCGSGRKYKRCCGR